MDILNKKMLNANEVIFLASAELAKIEVKFKYLGGVEYDEFLRHQETHFNRILEMVTRSYFEKFLPRFAEQLELQNKD